MNNISNESINKWKFIIDKLNNRKSEFSLWNMDTSFDSIFDWFFKKILPLIDKNKSQYIQVEHFLINNKDRFRLTYGNVLIRSVSNNEYIALNTLSQYLRFLYSITGFFVELNIDNDVNKFLNNIKKNKTYSLYLDLNLIDYSKEIIETYGFIYYKKFKYSTLLSSDIHKLINSKKESLKNFWITLVSLIISTTYNSNQRNIFLIKIKKR